MRGISLFQDFTSTPDTRCFRNIPFVVQAFTLVLGCGVVSEVVCGCHGAVAPQISLVNLKCLVPNPILVTGFEELS